MQNRLIARVLLVAGLATAFAVAAATNVYRWVGNDGKVHFSDTPPPQDARSVSQRQMGGGYVESLQLPYATQVAMKRNPVALYTSDACKEACDRARELLSNRGIPFTEHHVRTSADVEALRKIAGAPEVPLLLVGDNKLRGYSEGGWQAALDSAGYARDRLPGQPPSQPVAAASADSQGATAAANGEAPAANPPAR